jgi:hypothetical protein
VITKRSSSLSKSPRSRSLTPSRRRPPSQGSAPSISRPPSRAEDPFTFPRSASQSSTVLNHDTQQSPIHTEPSHHDSLVTSSTSHSSSSSTQDSPYPPTPSDSYVEPIAKDKSIVPDFDATHVSENHHTSLSFPQRNSAPDSPPSSNPVSVPTNNGPLDAAWVKPQPSDEASHYVHTPSPPSRTEPALTDVPLTGPGHDHTSRVSAAMSDGAADIGLSMLQGFGNADDYDDGGGSDDDDDDGDNFERTSLDDTVDGFPAPPTQIPTSSRASPSVLDTQLRPPSTHSDDSEDGDGASFYDNYRYSRLSISSKMSKSSAHAIVAVPPPVPTELPPSVRHSSESQLSTPTSPLVSEPSPTSPSSQGTPPPAARLQTRNVPPPLTLGLKSSHGAAPSISTVSTASPLLYTNFTSPLSSPSMGSNTSNSRSPLSPVFDFRGSGAASALRQQIESKRTGSSPLSSPLPSANSQERTFEQSQRADREEDRISSSPRGLQPRTPTSPTVSTTSSTSEKKRGGPSPLVVMNQAPPPPYTPTSPLTPAPLASPTYSPMPMPSPVVPRISPQPPAEPGPSQSRTSLFLPHPNAPKPSVASQGPLYWRSMPSVPPPPQNGVIPTLRRALTCQMRVGPNGLPQFSTIYGSTTQDLLGSVGPVPIFFSTEPPPNDIPVNRMRVANAPSPPAPIPVKVISPSQGGLLPPAERHASTTSNKPNVIPRTNFVPKATTARPRSRSFSGFDSPTNPAAQQKEKRFV